jgi:hypothetical protein
MAGNGSLQHQIVVGIGGYRSPKEIQAMQSALSTDCVYNVVNIFLGKAKLKAVTLENGLVLQYTATVTLGRQRPSPNNDSSR